MNRPFAAIILAYAAGILLGYLLAVPPGFLFGGAFILLILALLLAKSRPFLLWPLLLLAGWSNLALRTEVRAPDDLRTRFGNQATLVTAYGRLGKEKRESGTVYRYLNCSSRNHGMGCVNKKNWKLDEIEEGFFQDFLMAEPADLLRGSDKQEVGTIEKDILKKQTRINAIVQAQNDAGRLLGKPT